MSLVWYAGRWLEGQQPPYVTEPRVAIARVTSELFAVACRHGEHTVVRLHSAAWFAQRIATKRDGAGKLYRLGEEVVARLNPLLPPLPALERGSEHTV